MSTYREFVKDLIAKFPTYENFRDRYADPDILSQNIFLAIRDAPDEKARTKALDCAELFHNNFVNVEIHYISKEKALQFAKDNDLTYDQFLEIFTQFEAMKPSEYHRAMNPVPKVEKREKELTQEEIDMITTIQRTVDGIFDLSYIHYREMKMFINQMKGYNDILYTIEKERIPFEISGLVRISSNVMFDEMFFPQLDKEHMHRNGYLLDTYEPVQHIFVPNPEISFRTYKLKIKMKNFFLLERENALVNKKPSPPPARNLPDISVSWLRNILEFSNVGDISNNVFQQIIIFEQKQVQQIYNDHPDPIKPILPLEPEPSPINPPKPPSEPTPPNEPFEPEDPKEKKKKQIKQYITYGAIGLAGIFFLLS
jgi:hypothetical protein